MVKKRKFVKIPKRDVEQWIDIANLFAKSLISKNVALKEYNSLSVTDIVSIQKEIKKYDDLRRKKIPEGEMNTNWEISVMVDSHIIATEYNVNPLVVMMCVNPPCKPNERIFC